jgi:hypothetical protein
VGRASAVATAYSLYGPAQQAFVVRESRELGPAPLGEHGDIDRRVKTWSRCDSALPNGVHQA